MLNYLFKKNYNLVGIDPTINKFKKFYNKNIKKIPNFFNKKLIDKYLKKKSKKYHQFQCFMICQIL